ncbi:F-box domain-containing protein [Mycena venus]|uniref:F-box domain-containing protein n=1 Tax=Mycena venus TaxID=2733690 RepID=A0A8H7CCC5_9AGAR|nr:F-box domain-containing protein [Mycena venus]
MADVQSNQSLRDRLGELDAQIALLQAERKIIQRKLSSIIYPVLSLPFDVTSEIFIQCIPELSDSDPIFKIHTHRNLPTPFLLSQICRAWRHVALKTPQLWAVFSISLEDWPQDCILGARRLAEWVERAGSSPLSLVIGNPPTISPTTPVILDSILRLSMQWRNVGLHLPSEDFTTEKFQSLHGRLPCLEELHLARYNELGMTVVTAFEQAPNLRTVVLDGVSPTAILLPWAQLTHFRGDEFNGLECLHALRSASSLVECNFIHVKNQYMRESALLPPHLGLKVLYLTGELVCLDILCLLTLPALSELNFRDGDRFELHEQFLSFLSRSHPPLEQLSLHRGYQRLMHCFPFLRQLAVLELTGMTEDDMPGFLHALRFGLADSPPVPSQPEFS